MVLIFSLPAYAQAQERPTEPVGGQPQDGAKPSVSDLDYQVKYQRAFEAVIWSMPAIGGKNEPIDHFGPILIDKANGLEI